MLGNRKHELKSKLAALDRSYATIEFQMDGTILTANDNFLSATGYELSEIQGKKHSIFIDSAYTKSEAYSAFWDKLRAGDAFLISFPALISRGNGFGFRPATTR